MNAVPLHNRAVLSANANHSSTESLEARVARLEAIIQQRNTQSRGMGMAPPKPASVKSVAAPRMDIDAMQREVEQRVAAMRAAELKILNRVSGRSA